MILEDSLFNDSLERKQALKAAFTEPCDDECSGKANLNDSLDFEHTQLPFEEVAMVPCDTSIDLSHSDETDQTMCEVFSKTEKGLRCDGKDNTSSSQDMTCSQHTYQAPREGVDCTDMLFPDDGSSNKNTGNADDQRSIQTSPHTISSSTHPPSTANGSQLRPVTHLEKVVPLFGQKRKPSFVPPTSHLTDKCKTVPPPDEKSKPLPVDEESGKSKQVLKEKDSNKNDEVGGGDQCVPQTADKKAPHKVKHTVPKPKTSSKQESNREKTEGDQKRQQESKLQKNSQDKIRKKISETEKDKKRAQLEQKRKEREEEKERKKLDKERKRREAEEKKAEKEKLKKEWQMECEKRKVECEKRKAEREKKRKDKKMVHKKNQEQKGENENVLASSDSSKDNGKNAMSPQQQSSSQGKEDVALPHEKGDITCSPQSVLHEEEPALVISSTNTQKISDNDNNNESSGSSTQVRADGGESTECGVTSPEEESSLPEGSSEPSKGGRDDSMQMEIDETLTRPTHAEKGMAVTQIRNKPDKSELSSESAGASVCDTPSNTTGGRKDGHGNEVEGSEFSSIQNKPELTVSENKLRSQAMKVVLEESVAAKKKITKKKCSRGEAAGRKETKTPEMCEAEGKGKKSHQVPHVSVKSGKTLAKKEPSQGKNEGKETKKMSKKRKAKPLGELDDTSEPKQKRSKPTNYHGPVWVQCDMPQCQKWRQIKDCSDPLSLPDTWNCSMNPGQPLSVFL